MKVLHVTPYFAPAFCYGGPPRSIHSLCRGLKQIDVQVSVLTTTANGPGELPASITANEDYDGIATRYVPRSFPKKFFVARQFARHLNELLPRHDLVHLHGCWNYVAWKTMRHCRRNAVPYVVSPRGMLDQTSLRHSSLKKWLALRLGEGTSLRGAAAFQASTEEERARIEDNEFGRPIDVIPNSLDTQEFDDLPSREAARRELGIPAGDSVFIYVGRLHPQKGLDVLCEAFRIVVGQRPHCRLILVGDGDPIYRLGLQQRFHDLVAGQQLIFAGQLEGPRRLKAYAASNVFAFASQCESFGMSVCEAMASGLPVVLSRECPWPQVEQWNAGLRVPRVAAAFAQAMLESTDNRTRWDEMGSRGRKGVMTHFGLESVAQQMRQLYQRCLSGRWGESTECLALNVPQPRTQLPAA